MGQFTSIIRKHTEHSQCKLQRIRDERVAVDAIIMWSSVFIVSTNNHTVFFFYNLFHCV
jgi:hypothetical protein